MAKIEFYERKKTDPFIKEDKHYTQKKDSEDIRLAYSNYTQWKNGHTTKIMIPLKY